MYTYLYLYMYIHTYIYISDTRELLTDSGSLLSARPFGVPGADPANAARACAEAAGRIAEDRKPC